MKINYENKLEDKMKTKKSGVYAVLTAAVLIITAILITTCLEPITGFKPPETERLFPQIPEDFVPAPGKGVVQFYITKTDGRYVLPDVEDEEDFTEFDLYVYNDVTPGGSYQQGVDTLVTPTTEFPANPMRITALSNPIELEAGSYFFKLDAYQYNTTSAPSATNCCTDCNGTSGGDCECDCCGGGNACESCSYNSTVAATGVSASVTLALNQPNNVPITLKALGAAAAGQGQFNFSFIHASHGYSALPQMTITPLSAGGSTPAAITITNDPGSPQTQLLNAGYYRISIAMSQTNYQTQYYIDTLWIYQGMTSTLAKDTLPTLKSTLHNIHFYFRDGRNPAYAVETATHGTTFSSFSGTNTNYQIGNVIHSTDPTKFCNGWYTTDTLAADAVISTAIVPGYRLLKNELPLYAGWIEGTSLITILSYTFDAPQAGDEPDVNTSVTSFNFDTTDIVITYTVTNATAFTGPYSWSTSVEGHVTSQTSSVFSLTIDEAAFDYKLQGGFSVTVQVLNPTAGLVSTVITTAVN